MDKHDTKHKKKIQTQQRQQWNIKKRLKYTKNMKLQQAQTREDKNGSDHTRQYQHKNTHKRKLTN